MNQDTIKERRYFIPSRFQEAMDEFKQITANKDLPIITNFNEPADIPRDHGLLFQPILERNKNKPGGPLQLTSYIVAHVPDLAVVQKTEQGTEYLLKALAELYGRRLKQDVAQAQASHTKVKLPQNLDEFLVSETRDNLFQNLMQDTVRRLKKNGGSLSLITQGILRNSLQSASFAKGMFPKIAQADWEGVLNAMIEEAEKQGIDTAVLKEWKANRETFTVDEPEGIKF